MRPPPQHPIESTSHTWAFSDETASNGHVSIGYRVSFNVPGWIVGAAFLESPLDTGHHTCELRTEFADPLHVFAWEPSPTGAFEGAWAWVRRRTPAWKVEADVVYQWLVGYEQIRYGYEFGALGSGLDQGDVHIVADNYDGLLSGAGIFRYGYPFEPGADNGHSTLYSVDVIFQPK